MRRVRLRNLGAQSGVRSTVVHNSPNLGYRFERWSRPYGTMWAMPSLPVTPTILTSWPQSRDKLADYDHRWAFRGMASADWPLKTSLERLLVSPNAEAEIFAHCISAKSTPLCTGLPEARTMETVVLTQVPCDMGRLLAVPSSKHRKCSPSRAGREKRRRT